MRSFPVQSCVNFLTIVSENYRDDPFSGTYNGNVGDGKTINVYGFNVATVNEKSQIVNVEVPDIILI